MSSVLTATRYNRHLLPAIVTAFFIPLQCTAAEITEEARAAAKERKTTVIAQAKQRVQELENQRIAAAKNRDWATVTSLLSEIKQARRELVDATKKTVEAYARESDRDGDDAGDTPAMPAPKPHRNDVDDEPAAPAPEPEPDPEAERRAAAAEAERQRLSGGCPLKITMVDFYHADVDSIRRGYRLAGMTSDIPSNLVGECTLVTYKLENCVDEPVEAYETLVQFLDGFDEVIDEHTLQGTLLAPHEERKTRNGWPKIDTAVQVRVFLQRTKLRGGEIWRREPHHEQVSEDVKKPQGAELGQ